MNMTREGYEVVIRETEWLPPLIMHSFTTLGPESPPQVAVAAEPMLSPSTRNKPVPAPRKQKNRLQEPKPPIQESKENVSRFVHPASRDEGNLPLTCVLPCECLYIYYSSQFLYNTHLHIWYICLYSVHLLVYITNHYENSDFLM